MGLISSSSSPFAHLDRGLSQLQRHKTRWVQVAIAERIRYLEGCMAGVATVAEAWATAACQAKGIDPNSSLAGEEWIVGPVATLLNLRMLINTLQANGQPTPKSLSQRTRDQWVARVFPDNLQDQLMWLGFVGEVWIEPGHPATQGRTYQQPTQQTAEQTDQHVTELGAVSLVLGAGNIAAIAAMDTLYHLFAKNQVVLLKLNPVNAYIGPFLKTAFQPLIADGFLAIVDGDAEVGHYLCHHPAVERVHITGSHQTHDAIVWGSTPTEQRDRKTANLPLLTKPITSELGSITPILVVPGRWSRADLVFQARHVASMLAHNASFNCVAAKVLVLARGWQQRQEFLQYLHQQLAKTLPRLAYYPGAQQRYQDFLSRYPQAQPLGVESENPISEGTLPWTVIPDVPPNQGEYALTQEAFCGLLAEVTLETADATEFLTEAVTFANETLWGNLSCVLLADSETQRRYRMELEAAIANLRFGAIGINAWTGMGFLLPCLTWGAFPGNPLDTIQSGRGIVHNTYLFDYPQKSVIRAPFRIFPTPIWFADHKNLLQVAKGFAVFQQNPTWFNWFNVVQAAVKG